MKPKVLLLQAIIASYRVPIYNILAQNVDLTVGYTIKDESEKDNLFDTLQLNYRKIGGIYFVLNNLLKICSDYDVVIFMPDLHYFSYCVLPFVKRKYKVIPWSIGIRASYTKRYDVHRKKEVADKIIGKILQKSDAIIFYHKAAIDFWGNLIEKNKVFVAINTVKVFPNKNDESTNLRNRIIFIGTLYKIKKIYELIEAYIEAKEIANTKNFLVLDIIGKGEEMANLKNLIADKGLENQIILHGAIYDEQELSKYFSKSVICVSPDQAGLSVLMSMGYGVPFVTRANAITGGERLNIIHKENGLLYSSKTELVSIIIDAYNFPEKYIVMGNKAQNYYNNYATPQKMAQGVIDAINYALTKSKI